MYKNINRRFRVQKAGHKNADFRYNRVCTQVLVIACMPALLFVSFFRNNLLVKLFYFSEADYC